MSKLKIVMVGPPEVGKTVLSTFLGDPNADPVRGEYWPTKGARIVELPGCELWDVSGGKSYENCWPAVGRNADGLILVFNPDTENQANELVEWHDHFAKRHGVPDSQCIIFANQSSHMKGRPMDFDLPSSIGQLQVVNTNTLQSPMVVREAFEDFLKSVRSTQRNQRERDEQNLLSGR